MAISEYDTVARFAGSLPDGTDMEFTPHPCLVAPPLGDCVAAHAQQLAQHETALGIAADLHNAHATRIAEMAAELQSVKTECSDLQYRVRHLETMLHRHINREEAPHA